MSKFSSRIIGIQQPDSSPVKIELFIKIGSNTFGHFFMRLKPTTWLNYYAFITNEVYKNKNKSLFDINEVNLQDSIINATHSLLEFNGCVSFGWTYDNLVETIVKNNKKLKGKSPKEEPLGEFDFIGPGGTGIVKCSNQEEKDEQVSHISSMLDC